MAITPSETLNAETKATPAAASAEPTPTHNEMLYLTGRPTLKRFIRTVRQQAVRPEDEATLIAQWQQAKERIRVLKRTTPVALTTP